jgi:hypothetical protein
MARSTKPEISLAKTAKIAKEEQTRRIIPVLNTQIAGALFFLGDLGGLGERNSSSPSSPQTPLEATYLNLT